MLLSKINITAEEIRKDFVIFMQDKSFFLDTPKTHNR